MTEQFLDALATDPACYVFVISQAKGLIIEDGKLLITCKLSGDRSMAYHWGLYSYALIQIAQGLGLEFCPSFV